MKKGTLNNLFKISRTANRCCYLAIMLNDELQSICIMTHLSCLDVFL